MVYGELGAFNNQITNASRRDLSKMYLDRLIDARNSAAEFVERNKDCLILN
jgi:hypothetical protein